MLHLSFQSSKAINIFSINTRKHYRTLSQNINDKKGQQVSVIGIMDYISTKAHRSLIKIPNAWENRLVC